MTLLELRMLNPKSALQNGETTNVATVKNTGAMCERRGEVAWEPPVGVGVDTMWRILPLLQGLSFHPITLLSWGVLKAWGYLDQEHQEVVWRWDFGQQLYSTGTGDGYTEQVPTVQKAVFLGPSQSLSHHLAEEWAASDSTAAPHPCQVHPTSGRGDTRVQRMPCLGVSKLHQIPTCFPFGQRRGGGVKHPWWQVWAVLPGCPGGLCSAGRMEPREQSRILLRGVGTQHLACAGSPPLPQDERCQ